MLKQVILIRKDLKLSKGKLATQVAHASVSQVLKLQKENKKLVTKWVNEGMKKVALEVKDLEELLNYKKKFDENNITITLISDAGRTEVEPGTITCLGAGPEPEEKLDKITGNLKLL